MVLSDNRLLQGQVLLLYPQSGHGLRESELVWKNLSHGTAAGYPIRQCQEGSDPEGSDRSFQSYIIPALRLRLGRYRFHSHPYAAPLRSNGRAALRLLLLIYACAFSFFQQILIRLLGTK